MMPGAISEMSSNCENFNQGDYFRDGLLYCGICNTRKQTPITLNGKRYRVSCACRHESEAWNVRNDEKSRRASTKATRISFDEDDGSNPSVGTVRMYADGFEHIAKDGGGLILYGATGSGKTWACECLMNDLISRGISVLMRNVPEMVQKADIEGRWIDQVIACKLLILDDLGAERDTKYAQEIVYEAINSRYSRGKPTVVTTNMTYEQMLNCEDVTSQRIYGRLIERSTPVDFGNVNRRIDGVL